MKRFPLFIILVVSASWPIARAEQTLRIATYNVSLYGKAQGEVAERLQTHNDPQALRVARVLRHVRPDIVLLCELDYDPDGKAVNAFAQNYLAIESSDFADPPLDFPHRFSIPSNTGVLSGSDVNRDGDQALPDDAYGFGRYPGQYAMAILSRHPIEWENIRSFQKLRWATVPEAKRPIVPDSHQPYYDDQTWNQLRLSSKNHVDVPIQIDAETPRRLHFLVSHPTPPVFDEEEDRNGCRNHDEISFWSDYLSNQADYLIDDKGHRGGLDLTESFVVAGDLNSDPERGDSQRSAIRDLLSHERIIDPRPRSAAHGVDTAQFGPRGVRVDYVLPSRDWIVLDSGVFWPPGNSPLAKAVSASDHRLVWVDLTFSANDSKSE